MMIQLNILTLSIAQAAPGWWPWPERHRDIIHNWTDAFNFLDLIPGPPFLGFFALYALALFLIFLVLRTVLLRMLIPQSVLLSSADAAFRYKPGYLEIAYLRGGTNAMFEAAVCSLYQCNVINSKFKAHSTPTALDATKRLSRLQLAILANTAQMSHGEEIRNTDEVRQELNAAKAQCRRKLMELGLIPTRDAWLIIISCAMSAILFLDGIALIRIVRSLARGYRNVELLVFLMILFSALLLAGLCYIRRTHSGRIYLKQIEEEGWAIRRGLQNRTKKYSDPDVLYAVATIGAGYLSGTGYEDISQGLEEIVRISQMSRNSGGSCSSCSGGGCGGGGCGGGGCGGGGCGGG